MSWCDRHRLTLVTDTTSGVTAYTTGAGITGRVETILYTAGTTAFTTGAGVIISTVNTSQVIYQTTGGGIPTTPVSPRFATHTTSGGVLASSTAAAAGSLSGLPTYIYLANDHIKVVIEQAGAAKDGKIDIFIT